MYLRSAAFAIGLLGIFSGACLAQGSAAAGQNAAAGSTASEQADRETAYVNFFEAQRLLTIAERRPDRSDGDPFTEQARKALLRSIAADPGFAEAYTLLGEITIASPPFNIKEGIRLARKAVAANPNNFGGRRLLARLITLTAGLKSSRVTGNSAAAAITEWKAVTELDPRNAEAWAFLTELYELSGNTEDSINALRKWSASSPPVESQFYRNVMGQSADLDPQSAVLKLSSTLLDAGRSGEAATLLANVITDDPQNDEAVALLRDAVAVSNGNVSEMVAMSVRLAVSASPQNLGLLRLSADIYTDSHRFADAEKLLRDSAVRAAHGNPSRSSEILVVLGDIYAEDMRNADAVAVYEQALMMRLPREPATLDAAESLYIQDVISKLVRSYSVLKRTDAVLDLVERSHRLFGPDDVFGDRQLVQYYRSIGDTQEALSVLIDVRRRKPADQSYARLEASLVAEQGDVDKAVEIVRTASALARERVVLGDHPNTPTAFDEFSNLLFIAALYTNAGRGAEAKATSEEAVKIAGDEDRLQIAQLALAEAMRTQGDFAGAESTLRSLVKTTPGNPIALNNLGYFLTERGERLDEAVSLIKAALKVEPANPSYLDSLGWALFRSGKLQEAESYLRLAARIDSSSAAIHEHLGDVQAKLGKDDEARVSWGRALAVTSGKANTKRIRDKLRSGSQ